VSLGLDFDYRSSRAIFIGPFVYWPLQPDQQLTNFFLSKTVGYVPDGMSKEQYQQMLKKEKESKKGKNLGAYGPQSFKSRSLQAFQKDLETGKASHLMPVLNAKERLKRGELKQEDIPYMQRLGSWDNSDIGKKKKGNVNDEKYNKTVYQAPAKFDWTGRGTRSGPAQKKAVEEKPKKKLFGLF